MNFFEQMKIKHNIIFNSQQEQAILTIEGATLLLAVPGSGKTTVIITRIGNVIFNHSIQPEQILTLTFSVAAANDMQKRFVSLFGNQFENRLQFKTIHSFCFTVLREYERFKKTKAFEVLENNTQIIKQIYLKIYKEFIGDEIIKDISQKIGYCKNMMLEKEQIERITLPDCDFKEIYNEYEAYKKQKQLMDYDDMLNYALLILKKHPKILAKYQDQFKYFNVDEAQDTSYIQHEIIGLLVKKSGNVFMVGDEDQSIYGFRAAFPKALLDFKDTYKNANILLMERNYRSTKRIVELANYFIKQNKDRFEKNMCSGDCEGIDFKQTDVNDLNLQYKYITDVLKKEALNKSIAILYRNNDSAVPVVDALDHEKISFNIRENKPTFFSHFVVNDIICFMKLAQNNNDIDAFGKIYYKMNCNINKQIFEYAKQNSNISVFDTMLSMPDMNDKMMENIRRMKFDFAKLLKMTPLSAIEYIEFKLGYSSNLNNLSRKGYAKEQLDQKIQALKSIASRRKTFTEFLDRLIQLENIMLNSSNKNAAVTLTTFHSSKGLEFDKVIMVDIIEGQFPTQESIKRLDELGDRKLFEEEVRLFYVGITRARSELEIIISSHLNESRIRASRFVTYLIGYYKEKLKKTIIEQEKVAKKVFDEEMKKYTVGTLVSHTTFGEGIINGIEDGKIIVEFSGEGNKKLSLISCIQYGFLKRGT